MQSISYNANKFKVVVNHKKTAHLLIAKYLQLCAYVVCTKRGVAHLLLKMLDVLVVFCQGRTYRILKINNFIRVVGKI